MKIRIENNFHVVEYLNKYYAIDCSSLDIFEVNNIFIKIINLMNTLNEEEIISTLKSEYTLNDIKDEIKKVKEYYLIKSKEVLENQEDIIYKYIGINEIKKFDFKNISNKYFDKYILMLTVDDFYDENLTNLLDRTNIFTLLNMDEKDIDNNCIAYKNIKQYLKVRQGRFRINISSEDFVKCYSILINEGIKNFDIQLKSDYINKINDEEIEKIQALLMKTFNTKQDPYLAVIKDIIRIIAFKLHYKKACEIKCIGSRFCTNTDGSDDRVLCKLNKVYYNLGVLYVVKYLNSRQNNIHKILIEDLNISLTNKEKILLSKSYHWSRNLEEIYKNSLKNMCRNKENNLITFRDLNKSRIITGVSY